MIRKHAVPLLVTGAIAAAVGFGATASGATKGTGPAPRGTCVGEFHADMLSGPYADLSIDGRLFLVARPGGGLGGVLVRKDEATGHSVKLADVTGTIAGGRVRLSFKTVHGRRITGVGGASRELHCNGTLRGALTGPGGSRGVWKMSTVQFLYIPAPSFYSQLGCEPGVDGIILRDGGFYDCNQKSFVV